MARSQKEVFTLERRPGIWGRFHEAQLPDEDRPPIKLLTKDNTLPDSIIDMLWENKNEELKRERGILPEINNPISSALKKWADLGYPSQKNSKKDPGTVTQYKTSVTYYQDALGDHDLDEYSWDHAYQFQEYLEDMARPLKDVTINKHQRHFQIFISWCYATKRMKHLIVPPKVSVSEKIVETWTPQEIAIYKKGIEDSGDINLYRTFHLAYYHMMRGSEVWSLPIRNIRLDSTIPFIRITEVEDLGWLPKCGLEREVEIHNPKLLDFLKNDLVGEAGSRKRYIQTIPGESKYENFQNLSKRFAQIRKGVNIPQYDPLHTLRRTAITLMVEAGEDMYKLHDMSGHRSLDTTEKYYRAKRRRSGSIAAATL